MPTIGRKVTRIKSNHNPKSPLLFVWAGTNGSATKNRNQRNALSVVVPAGALGTNGRTRNPKRKMEAIEKHIEVKMKRKDSTRSPIRLSNPCPVSLATSCIKATARDRDALCMSLSLIHHSSTLFWIRLSSSS